MNDQQEFQNHVLCRIEKTSVDDVLAEIASLFAEAGDEELEQDLRLIYWNRKRQREYTSSRP